MQIVQSILIGKVIAGKYRLERMLGSGSMGYVFLATHTSLGRYRAIKILKDELVANEKVRQRFLREIKLTHEIASANDHIIKIYDDYGVEEGTCYYVMEYLEGEELEARLQTHPDGCPLSWVLRITKDICEAMQVVHDAGIIHRDLKPSNLFLTQYNDEDFVKIMDFGIARLEHQEVQLTKTGSALGTPLYMSPEQITGMKAGDSVDKKGLDRRTDIYSLGCILFELLTGRPPFFVANTGPLRQIEIFHKHLTETSPSLLDIRPDLPIELDVIIQKALQKNPDERYQSMHDFALALSNVPIPQFDEGYAPSTQVLPALDMKPPEEKSTHPDEEEDGAALPPETTTTPGSLPAETPTHNQSSSSWSSPAELPFEKLELSVDEGELSLEHVENPDTFKPPQDTSESSEHFDLYSRTQDDLSAYPVPGSQSNMASYDELFPNALLEPEFLQQQESTNIVALPTATSLLETRGAQTASKTSPPQKQQVVLALIIFSSVTLLIASLFLFFN